MSRKKEAILFFMPELWGFHTTAWRESEPRDTEMSFDSIRQMVQAAERAKFHACFFADTVAFGLQSSEASVEAVSRTSKGVRWEPVTLLSALSAHTRRIGLLGTVSTTFSEPYNVARMFASLDHISGGRAGWNVVTTAHPRSAMNFGFDKLMDHASRYERSEEFFDIVSGLWDTWEDDIFLRDKETGAYFDPTKLHALNYKGKYLSSAGPLNIARPPQGHPVIAQAGSSQAGGTFAARHADVIYTLQADLQLARAFRHEVRERAVANGRNPDHVKVLPAMVIVVGRSRAHAEERLARLDELVDPVLGMESLKGYVKFDLSGYPLDGPVPEIPETENASKTGQKYYLDLARRDNLTVRQLMQVVARHNTTAHTPETIAEHMQEWLEAGAADGFNITFSDWTDSMDVWVRDVVPELQRRGLLQTEYRGNTLRESLGLPRPPNRFTAKCG